MLERKAEELIAVEHAAGRGADTPAAVIHRGTTEAEETVAGTLGDQA